MFTFVNEYEFKYTCNHQGHPQQWAWSYLTMNCIALFPTIACCYHIILIYIYIMVNIMEIVIPGVWRILQLMTVICVNISDCCHVILNFAKGYFWINVLMVHRVGGTTSIIKHMSSTWFDKYYKNQLIMAKHPSTSLLRCCTLPSIGPYRMKVLCFKIRCRLDISCPLIIT